MTEEETNPLIERIARALHDHEWETRRTLDPLIPQTAGEHWRYSPARLRARWRAQADAVIDALDLGCTTEDVKTLGGETVMTFHEVEGQWIEMGGAR